MKLKVIIKFKQGEEKEFKNVWKISRETDLDGDYIRIWVDADYWSKDYKASGIERINCIIEGTE